MANFPGKMPIDPNTVMQLIKLFPIKRFGVFPFILVGILLLIVFFLPKPKVDAVIGTGEYRVQSFVDGDTLRIEDPSNPKGRLIRFLGIDTPETHHPTKGKQPYGEKASEYTKKRIEEAGSIVKIEYDGAELDKYGRTLGLVYIKTPQGEEVLLNEELVRKGLARAQTQYSYSAEMKDRFTQAESEAQKDRLNIWSTAQ